MQLGTMFEGKAQAGQHVVLGPVYDGRHLGLQVLLSVRVSPDSSLTEDVLD